MNGLEMLIELWVIVSSETVILLHDLPGVVVADEKVSNKQQFNLFFVGEGWGRCLVLPRGAILELPQTPHLLDNHVRFS